MDGDTASLLAGWGSSRHTLRGNSTVQSARRIEDKRQAEAVIEVEVDEDDG